MPGQEPESHGDSTVPPEMNLTELRVGSLAEHPDVSLKLLHYYLGQAFVARKSPGYRTLERPSITQNPHDCVIIVVLRNKNLMGSCPTQKLSGGGPLSHECNGRRNPPSAVVFSLDLIIVNEPV
jgi:hypothetical protein